MQKSAMSKYVRRQIRESRRLRYAQAATGEPGGNSRDRRKARRAKEIRSGG